MSMSSSNGQDGHKSFRLSDFRDVVVREESEG